MDRQLLSSKGEAIHLNLKSDSIISHWSDASNHADTILQMFNNGEYKPFLSDMKDATIVDLGANIGLFSLYAHDAATKIIAVEPTPSHFEKLRELTSGYSNIELVQAAVHSADEEVTFYCNDDNSTMNSTANLYGNILTVKGLKLSTILKDVDHVDFCKVDIEGSEVIAITSDVITELYDKIDAWHVTVHAAQGSSIEYWAKYFSEMFNNAGYMVSSPNNYDAIYATKTISI